MKSKTLGRPKVRTTSDRTGKILGPPCAEAFRNTIDAAVSLEKAYAADYKYAEIDFPESGRFKRSRESHFRDELWKELNLYRKSKMKIEAEFRARWFVWRAALPISIIVGVQPGYIFEAGAPMSTPRTMAAWLASTAGDVPAPDIADVIGRDRTTVLNSIKRARIGVADPSSAFYKLMTDLLDFETEHLWASKKSSPPHRRE